MAVFDPYAEQQQQQEQPKQQELSTFDRYLGIGSPAQRFVAGAINEPLMAAGQMVVDPIANLFGYGKPVTEYAQRIAQFEQQGRVARGDTGIDIAKLAGAIVSPATLVPAARITQAAGAGIRGGLLSGAATGVLGAPTLQEDIAAGKAEQAGYGALGGGIGAGITQGIARTLAPKINADEQLIRDLGIQPTTGEAVGGLAKKAEEFAARIPFVSALVTPARQASTESFNTAMFNRVLSGIKGANIGDKAPKITKGVLGTDAMREVDNVISQSYDKILPNMQYRLNTNTFSDISNTIRNSGLNADQQETVIKFMTDRFLNKVKAGEGKLDGEALKVFEADIRKKISSYSGVNKAGSDLEIGDTLKEIRNIFRNDLYTQNAKFVPELRKVDRAYAEAEVLRDAVNRVAPDKQGIFTPNDLSMAVRTAAGRLGEKSLSRGQAMLQKEAQAATSIMGGTDRGTSAVGALGAAYAGASNPAIAALGVTGIGIAYSKYGQKAIDTLITKRPEMARRLGAAIESAGSITPAISAQIERIMREENLTPEPIGGAQVFDPFQRSSQVTPAKEQIPTIIASIAQQKGVPAEVARILPAIAKVESGFDPMAKNKGSTASGLFQLTKAARQDVGVTDPFNVKQNIEGGTDYFMMLYKRYNGDIKKALAAYNQGAGKIDKGINKAGRDYANKVLRNI